MTGSVNMEKMELNRRAKASMHEHLKSLSWPEKVRSIDRMNRAARIAREAMRRAQSERPRPAQVRVLFHLDPAENVHGVKTETLWAVPTDSGNYRIANSPFYIFGISAEDVVSAKNAGGTLVFESVVSKGGHSTHRIFLIDGKTIRDSLFEKFWAPIRTLGATFENANDRFVAVDIPPEKDTTAIYGFLENGENEKVWILEEADSGH